MEQLDIETSRHVRLTYTPASVLQRIFAWLLDASLYLVYIIVTFWILGILFTESAAQWQGLGWITYLVLFTPYFLYFPLIETAWNGRTIGKKIVGIRVVRVDGTRASLGSYLVRWIFRFIEISGTGGVIAILTILINGKGQRLGDIAAGTSVIHETKDSITHRELTRNTGKGHKVVFENTAELSDEDIRIIKEVLNKSTEYSSDTRQKMMRRTRKLIEKKTGETDSSLSTKGYLVTILKDYAAIYGPATKE